MFEILFNKLCNRRVWSFINAAGLGTLLFSF